jgi:hypothetical protein
MLISPKFSDPIKLRASFPMSYRSAICSVQLLDMINLAVLFDEECIWFPAGMTPIVTPPIETRSVPSKHWPNLFWDFLPAMTIRMVYLLFWGSSSLRSNEHTGPFQRGCRRVAHIHLQTMPRSRIRGSILPLPYAP